MLTNKIYETYHIKSFEKIYFFIMVIYMAFMTPETRVTTGGIATRPIAFSIPIILTIILLIRNKINYNNKYYKFLLILCLWIITQIIVKKQFNVSEIINYIYIIYAYILAYIHFSVYGKNIFRLYESIIVILAKISIIIWGAAVLFPSINNIISNVFPATGYGHNILYLVNLMNPSGDQVTYGIIRNAGCSWEPGRYAIMICLAILFNLYSNGITLKNNKKVIWLLFALLTTMSTTGYVLCAILYLYFYVKTINIKYIASAILLIIGFLSIGLHISFIGEKLREKLNVKESIDHIESSWQWTEENNEKKGVAYSMDRFPSIYYESINFIHDPIIGYGANSSNSYFYQNYTTSIGFTGGLVQILSKHGIFIGLILLFILYKSSKIISKDFNSSKVLGFFIYSIFSMISYPLLWQNLYTALWFYGFFKNKK